MSRQEHREEAVNIKLKELKDLSEQRVEVDRSIWELKKYYAELTRKIDTVKGEIRFLGGTVPDGSQYTDRMMLGHLIDGRGLHDLRP
ncbi:unnamed protein product [marine sediment metagenome]|uniref:Uncharacterized protein n=1 Tax=marine sediment metagenome TaxID=412755 RepID=X1PU99_9ZZZZ